MDWPFCSNRFLRPLNQGKYPSSMRRILGDRLPKFTKEQSALMNGSYDFIGVNYYASVYAKNNPVRNSVELTYNTDPEVNQTGTRKTEAIYTVLLVDFAWIHHKKIY